MALFSSFTTADYLGLRLLLWAGPVIPLPVSFATLDAIERVEVTCSDEDGDGFQLTFRMTKSPVGEYDLMLQTQLKPYSRVIIGALMGLVPKVLIDGVILHQEIIPDDQGSSQLKVTGRDLCGLLDQVEQVRDFPAQSDAIIALRILTPYSRYGVIPQITPTIDVPVPTELVPWQHETDLCCLQRLAQRNSYVFYIEPVSFGVSRAYFGPENRLNVPQSPLRTDMGPQTNVRSLSFSYAPSQAELIEAPFFVPFSAVAMELPPAPNLSLLPLTLWPDVPRRQRLLGESAKYNPIRAVLAAQAEQRRSAETVTATGTLDTLRYGDILCSRRLISVCGAGLSFDGLYYVSAITHEITRTSYTQQFTLSREGTVSNTPVVPT